MNNYISRNDAASILGVHPQTISNYAADGYFNIIKTPANVFIEKESFDKFIEKFSVSAKSNEEIQTRIDERKKELTKKLSDLENEANGYFKMLSARNDYAKSLGVWGFSFLAKLFDKELVFALALDETQTKWVDIFKSYVSGECKLSICERFKVSKYTLYGKMYRTLLLLKNLPDVVNDLIRERRELQFKIAKQKEHIKKLQGINIELQRMADVKISEITDETEVKKTAYALNVNVFDSELSVRALNLLRVWDVRTLQDITNLSMKDLKGTRNLGRKTLCEIQEFLELHRQASGFDFQLRKD